MYKYAHNSKDESKTAKAVGMSLPISYKVGAEICNFIRSKPLAKAKEILDRVILMKEAIPYKKFNKDVGHKPGKMAAGRYPVKASQIILDMLKSAESNAVDKGLVPKSLVVRHVLVHKASNQWHHGRQRRTRMKRGHVEVILEEALDIKPEPKKPKVEKKVEEKPKVEEKKLEETITEEKPVAKEKKND